MAVIGWRVWYADGQIFDSKTAQWRDLPDSGLQVLMLYFDQEWFPGKPYRQVIHGDDFYDYGGKRIEGTLLPDDQFNSILVTAMASEAW